MVGLQGYDKFSLTRGDEPAFPGTRRAGQDLFSSGQFGLASHSPMGTDLGPGQNAHSAYEGVWLAHVISTSKSPHHGPAYWPGYSSLAVCKARHSPRLETCGAVQTAAVLSQRGIEHALLDCVPMFAEKTETFGWGFP